MCPNIDKCDRLQLIVHLNSVSRPGSFLLTRVIVEGAYFNLSSLVTSIHILSHSVIVNKGADDWSELFVGDQPGNKDSQCSVVKISKQSKSDL